MAPVRDKRYTHPVLWADLFEGDFEVAVWTKTGMLIDGGENAVGEETNFNGMFSFAIAPSEFGLFEATVTHRDAKSGLVRMDFGWVSKDGQALLERVAEAKDEKTGRPLNKIRVTRMRKSVNWSFSGGLFYYVGTAINGGDQIRGMLRVEKTNETGYFLAGVVRRLEEKGMLALKFNSLNPDTFAMLEAAMKKQG